MISSSLYKQIKALMPIPCVEAIIMKDDSLLFLRRKNSPAKGEWWFPGGRIRKGETFKETLLREKRAFLVSRAATFTVGHPNSLALDIVL